MRARLLIVALLAFSRPLASQQPLAPVQHLGTVRFAVSCKAPAQADFNRAVALLHSFAFSQAIEGFSDVLRIDPRCAMAYWGLALSAWGNPFAAGVKPGAQIERGLTAIRGGRSVGASTARERAYIEAAAALYEHADSLDQLTRLLAYRDSMAALSAREPSDTEAAIFHALAQAFSADPSDKSYANQLAAGATLERLFAVLPDHPGLAHYIIHSYDVPSLAARALVAAHRYSEIAPGVSHALHMPSHVYTRVGDWQESIDANIAAAAAAAREGATAEQLHAMDYQVYAYLQSGQDSAASRMVAALPALARRLDPNAVSAAAPPAAGYFALAAIPARYVLEHGNWAGAARLEAQPSPVPFADAMSYFARALGAARTGDTITARTAIAELERLRDLLADHRESYWSGQVEIQRRAAMAWLDFAAGRRADGLREMQGTADREDATEKNAITPGPLAPARELLGEMLLESHQPIPALEAFQSALVRAPNRFRAVAGAARAASEAGDRVTAETYFRQLLALCPHADRPGRTELIEATRLTGGIR